jgi:RNA recognition motif-containing protein
METNKLYVWGIPWPLEWQDIKDLFKQFGEVNHVKIIKDRESGKSKWYGFVEFAKVEHAVSARETMNWSDLDGRLLKVEFAEEKIED